MANSPSGDSVTDRVVRVLETFGPDRTVQTAAQIGRRAGLPSSTAHRLVAELVEAGLLERDDEHRVRLGMRLWELALRGSTALRLRQAALPFMERVQARVREHTQLAVLEQDEALFLERLSSPARRRQHHPHRRAACRCTRRRRGSCCSRTRRRSCRRRVLAKPARPLSPETITDAAALRRTLAEVRRHGSVIAPGSIEAVSTGVAVPCAIAAPSSRRSRSCFPRDAPTAGPLEALRAAAAGIQSALAADRR